MMQMMMSYGAVTKVLTYLGSNSSITTATTYTVTAAALGTAAADRSIIVAIAGANSSRTISSVTVGGVSATINVQYTEAGDNNVVGIATALVPTGTTGDIVVTYSGSQASNQIGWWSATGLTSNAAIATGSSNLPGVSQNGTITLTSVAGGFFIGVAGSSGGPATFTWTNATERFDTNASRAASGADALTTTTSIAVTAACTSTNTNRGFVGATFYRINITNMRVTNGSN